MAHHQVVIVGGGPVGVALAVELAQRNIDTVVLERSSEVGRIPKGQNLTQRSLEHFYFWHCVDELRARRPIPKTYPIGGITAYGNLMSKYWYAPAGLERMESFYFQANERLPQYLTETVLRERLGSLPSAHLRLGAIVGDIRQEESSVSVAVSYRDGSTETLTAQYVVGCDGSHSTVRASAGIGLETLNFDQKMVLTVFRSPVLHRALERFPERTTYRVLDPDFRGIWQFFGRVDLGERWFFHGPIDTSMSVEDPTYLHQCLARAAGFDVEEQLDYVGSWDLRIEMAREYRNGRIFLAGDAAHSHPPYGGFGLNTGLEDITNLGWKLAAVLDGWADEELLSSYGFERQPVFRDTGWGTIASWIKDDETFLNRYRPENDLAGFEDAWGKRTLGDLPGPEYEPNYEGSPLVVGQTDRHPGAIGTHIAPARAGHHLCPQLLGDGRNAYHALGSGFTLFCLEKDASAAKLRIESSHTTTAPLSICAVASPEAAEHYEASFILVRPDQFVVWSSDCAPKDIDALMRTASGST